MSKEDISLAVSSFLIKQNIGINLKHSENFRWPAVLPEKQQARGRSLPCWKSKNKFDFFNLLLILFSKHSLN